MAAHDVAPANFGLGMVFNVQGSGSLSTSPFVDQDRLPAQKHNVAPRSSKIAPDRQQYLRRKHLVQEQRLKGAMDGLAQAQATCYECSTFVTPIHNMASQNPQKQQLAAYPSVVDSSNFKLLYADQYSLSHFARTKEQLPFEIVWLNKELLRGISKMETGLKIDYQALRHDVERLAKESTIAGNSPRVFDFVKQLMIRREHMLEAGARFVSYDLWLNMIKAYYGATNDGSLLSMLPIMDPTAIEDYLKEAAVQLSPQNVDNRRREWDRLYETWVRAEASLNELKSSAECRLRFEQIAKLKEIFDHCYADRAKLAHDQRRAQSALRRSEFREKRLAIRQANSRNMRFQYGQEGMHEMPITLALQLGHDNAKHTTEYIADEQLPQAMHQVSFQEHPDSMTNLTSQAA